MKCTTLGAAGLKEIARYHTAKKKIENDQLDLLGFPKGDTL